MSHGPCATALGPLLQRRETGCPDRIPVARLVLLQQPVANQQRDATAYIYPPLTAALAMDGLQPDQTFQETGPRLL